MTRQTACTLIVLLTLAGTADAARRKATAAIIDDFEDRDLIAPSGSAWVPIGDDLLGGKTTLRLEATRDGSDGSRGALRLTGKIGGGPAWWGKNTAFHFDRQRRPPERGLGTPRSDCAFACGMSASCERSAASPGASGCTISGATPLPA